MAIRFLVACLLFIILYCSVESTNKMSNDRYFDDFPLYFTSYICHRQKQYPLKKTSKFCSTRFQSYKPQQEKQQRRQTKRVGWTISV